MRRLFRALAAAITFVAMAAATLQAESVRVLADRTLIWNSSMAAVVVGQVNRGAVLDVVRRVGRWYEVRLPATRPGDDRTGFILVTQVAPEGSDASAAGVPQSAARPAVPPQPGGASRPPARPQAQPGGNARRAPRGAQRSSFLAVNAAYAPDPRRLTVTTPAFASTYQEEGSITAVYGRASPLQLHVQGAMLFGQVGLGGGVVAHTRSSEADIVASVPHPFFFDRHRAASGTSGERLSMTALEFQVPLVWQRSVGSRMSVILFGGPSIFRVSREVVAGLEIAESYPYDAAAIGAVTTRRTAATGFGFHAGGQAYWGGRTAVGVGAMYSRGTVDFSIDETRVKEQAGGFSVLAGLRQRF